MRRVVLVPLALAVIFTAYALIETFVPFSSHDGTFEVQIRRGSSFREATEVLYEQGLVTDRGLFTLLAYGTGLHKRIKPGYYEFQGRLSMWDVYKILRARRIVERKVLVVEGSTLSDIRRKLLSLGLINGPEFDRLVRDPAFMSSLEIHAPSLEGYLFPDTYIFPKGIQPEELLSAMIRRLRDQLTPSMLERARGMGYNEREVLTLASIVEREARLDRERPMVSAVYQNRLKLHMPLQSDPTAIYGIKPMCEGVTSADLRRHTAYNTYVIKGLPPGPIAAPGLRAIEAVLNPSPMPYLYFVADGTGGHLFSTSYAEHQRAVDAYRRMLRRTKK